MSSWSESARPVGQVGLGFTNVGAEVISNLSAGARIGDTLFVAADEYPLGKPTSIESLVSTGGGEWGRHDSFALPNLVAVDDPDAEADLEGLAIDDGWLWFTGSHAATRPKPERRPDKVINLDKLATLKDARPRALLGRIPLVRTDERWTLAARDGDRRAGLLLRSGGGSPLAAMFKVDPLLAPFARLPAKEGGIDVEGLAVSGSRVALGMRGPVIGGNALLIEFTVVARKSGRLEIVGAPFKRLLALDGLGIRDLAISGDDLLILAGPTMALSGPATVYRWPQWVHDRPRDAHLVRLHALERMVELPFGRGEDHPEGLCLWDDGAVMVICDRPSSARLDLTKGRLLADLFAL